MKKRPLFSFYGTLNKITTKLDGGGRIELDFDKNCLLPAQQLQQLQLRGDVLIAIAAVPVYPGEPFPEISYHQDHLPGDCEPPEDKI